MSIIIITSITINNGYDNITILMLDYLVKIIINFCKEAKNIPCQNREDINKLCFSY